LSIVIFYFEYGGDSGRGCCAVLGEVWGGELRFSGGESGSTPSVLEGDNMQSGSVRLL